MQRWEVLANDILNDAVKRQIPPRHGSRRHPSSADIGWTHELASSAAQQSCHTSWPHRTGMRRSVPRTPLQRPMEVDALTPPRRKAKGGDKGLGTKGPGKTHRKPADDKTSKTCYVCGKLGHNARTAGIVKGHLRENTMARHRVKERPKGKGGGKDNEGTVRGRPTRGLRDRERCNPR